MKCLRVYILAPVMLIVLTGCGGSFTVVSPHMVDSLNYVRQHKGEGLRRAMLGSEAELMDTAVKNLKKFAGGNYYTIVREPHAVLATTHGRYSGNYAYAFYFYPSKMNDRTEVEVLVASPYSGAESLQRQQEREFATTLFDLNRQLLDKEYDPNVKVEGVRLALATAAFDGQLEAARKLINKGADPDLAIHELKESASTLLPYLDNPPSRAVYDRLNLAVEMLNRLNSGQAGRVKVAVPAPPEDPKETAAFEAEAKKYRALAVKPTLPEEARKYNVQAVAAFKDKQFSEAAGFYANALKMAPWWPDGHFNRALILGELNRFVEAQREMKRYLLLTPDAPNARAAQDKIYEWERFTSR